MLDQEKTKARMSVHTHREFGDSSDSESESEDEDGEDVFSEEEQEEVEEEDRPLRGQSALPKSASGKVKTARGRNERVMPPEECRAHLRRLFRNESVMCSLLFGQHGPFSPLTQHNLSLASADMFFLEVIPVSPTRFRPPAKMGEMLFEHPQNELLAKVLTTSYRLRDLNVQLRMASLKGSEVDDEGRRRILQSLLDSLVQLQIDVNCYIDSSKNPAPIRQGRLPPAGVKQGLEKKEGLFRKHMMVSRSERLTYSAHHSFRANASIMLRGLSFPQTLTSNPTKLASLLSLHVNLRSRNP